MAALSCVLATGAAGQDAPDKYIVVLKANVPAETVEAAAQRIVGAARPEIPSLRLKRRDRTGGTSGQGEAVVFRRALRGFAIRMDAADADKIERLERQPDVAFVAEDSTVRLHTQLFQPGMERIRVSGNALSGVGDSYDVDMDVDIAIVDSGIDAAHPDLNVYRSVSFVTSDPSEIDANGHGTHVAGIAAAIDDDNGVYGVAPGARLWAVKVVDQSGFGELSDLLAGLDYVAAHADEIDVANLSLGGPSLGDDGNCGATVGDPLHQAICAVVDAGVVVVTSAGNYPPYGRDASLVSPACYDEVITVSAVEETDGLGPGAGQGPGTVYGPDNAFARTFSNYGWDVDIAAPGVEIVSTWPGGGYSVQSGTSMAGAHVSGAAAVWIVKYGKPGNRDEVLHARDELVRLAFPQSGPDEGFSGDVDTFAEPLLNVAAIDPAVFDPVDPRLDTDRSAYEYGVDSEAVVTVVLKDENGDPLDGIPSNGFQAYLAGRQREVQFQAHGQGTYTLTLNIEYLPPGDHEFMAVIANVAGFVRSGGCRIVVRYPEPRLIIHDFAFVWPVMNYDSFFDTNFVNAFLMDEKGAPVLVSPDTFDSTFSGGGPGLVWSLPAPDPLSGLSMGITYGAYQSRVDDVHSLPLGTHVVDLTASRGGLSDSASASFDMAYYDPLVVADLSSNLSTFDFTQPIAPPALDLAVHVTSEWLTGVSGLLFLVDQPFELRIDGQAVPGLVFEEDPSDRGTYRAHDVDLEALAHGTHTFVVHVTDSRGLEVDSNPLTIDVVRETGPCADPLATGGDLDTDGDGIRDECDNCPTVSNRSQRANRSGSADEAGLGDACKTLPRLWVSSDPIDDPDFFTIRDAVEQASAAPVVWIEILPGTGPYVENVVVDRGQSFHVVGRNRGADLPVVQATGAGGAAFDLRSAGDAPVVVRNLIVRGEGIAAGQQGISAGPGVATHLSELRFEELGEGMRLGAGPHVVTRIATDATVGTGLVLEDGTLSLSASRFLDADRAIRMIGPASLADADDLLVVGQGAGECISSASTVPRALDLRHSTLVDCGTAVSAGSGSAAIAHSILWNNQTDVDGVACADITWSDVQQVDCGGTNVSVDPLFESPASGDYHLQATSPLLDHGPDPALYTGVPCTDLDGRPRLRDHDGDQLAQVDPGAYERTNTAIAPQEVAGLVWTTGTLLTWDPVSTASTYHVYRAPLSTLAYSAFGACADDLDAVLGDTALTDPTVPPPGDGLYYVVTAEDLPGGESSLGVGTCAERSNFNACP